MLRRLAIVLASSCLALPFAAQANVAQVSANGLVIRHLVHVPATADETWAVLVKPSVWWDSEHTWSGSAANLTLDARPGGCFCEVLPAEGAAKAPPRGGVEHMRVIYVERGRAIRLTGALGPLQADAITGTLTFQIKSDPKGGAQVLLEYVAGGFSRTPFDKLAPAVDTMLGAQMTRLSGKLGGAFSAAFPAEEPEAAAPLANESSGEGSETPSDTQVLPLPEKPPVADGPLVGR